MYTYCWSPLSVFWIGNMLVFFSNLFRVFFVVWKKIRVQKRKFSYMKNLTTKWKLIRHLQDKKMTVVYLRGVWRGLHDHQRPKTFNLFDGGADTTRLRKGFVLQIFCGRSKELQRRHQEEPPVHHPAAFTVFSVLEWNLPSVCLPKTAISISRKYCKSFSEFSWILWDLVCRIHCFTLSAWSVIWTRIINVYSIQTGNHTRYRNQSYLISRNMTSYQTIWFSRKLEE